MAYEFLPERPEDAERIEPLLDRTFGFDRRAKTVYRLREGVPPCAGLCFVALAEDGALVASLRFWPIRIEETPAILLGPLAVEPALQGIGIGRGLVRHGLTEAKRQGERLCVVVGEPSYYGPYGFTSAAAAGLILPGPVEPHRFQVLELVPGALDGVHGLIARSEAPAKRRRGRRLAG
ncbi:MAG TPA: N-acetyltransferase [Kiloniellales bacterium]|nr:N-acetyltransferase [Kiloniellales bacterium]